MTLRQVGGCIALAIYVLVTQTHRSVWSSDLTLYYAAVRVTPDLPRPTVNLAATYAQLGQWEFSCVWQRHARTLSSQDPKAQEVLRALSLWTVAFGPSSRSACSSLL